MMKLNKSLKTVIHITKYNYSISKSVLCLTTQNQVELKINEIPNNSNILIGGYLTHGVPNSLINILTNSKCHNLTLITNASIVSNQNLRELFKTKGKVKRIITSLENNRTILLDKDLVESNILFELNVLNCSKFIHEYCNKNAINDKGEYALVKSDYVDKNFNLYWSSRNNLYFNDSFAKTAFAYSIAESDNLMNENSINKDDMVKVDSLFVESVLVVNSNEKKQDNQQSFKHYLSLINDIKFESIVKRLLLELNQNNQNIYLSNDLKFLIKSFYMPKHLNLNILNRLIDMSWPSTQKWIDYVKKLDIIVCHAKMLNKNGEILFDNSIKSDCMEMDLINNLNEQTKLIAVIQFNRNNANEISKMKKSYMTSCKRKPNLIISDLGVFEYNKYENRYEMREYYSEENLKEISMSNFNFPFQLHINENNLKTMTKECI